MSSKKKTGRRSSGTQMGGGAVGRGSSHAGGGRRSSHFVYTPCYSKAIMIAESRIPKAGMGIIATEDIPANTVVLIEQYDPNLVNQYNSNNLFVRLRDQQPHHMTNDRDFTKYTYDWMGPGSAVFVPVISFFNNDNANTNCAFLMTPSTTTFIHRYLPGVDLKPIVVMTLKEITAGEELTLNYYPRTMSDKTLDARVKELYRVHNALWNTRLNKKTESKYIQFFNRLNSQQTSTRMFIQHFDKTEDMARRYLSEIYGRDGRSTPEYLDIFVYLMVMFRLAATINLKIASQSHHLTAQQIYQSLMTNAEPIRTVIKSTFFNFSIDAVKQTFAKLRGVLSDIEIHGPTSCQNPYQHVHSSQSLFSFINNSICHVIPGLEVQQQRTTHSTSSRSTAAPIRTSNPFLDFWFRGGMFHHLTRPIRRRPSQQTLLNDQDSKRPTRSTNQQIGRMIGSQGLLKEFFRTQTGGGGSAKR